MNPMAVYILLSVASVAVSILAALLRNRGREKGRLLAKLAASLLFCGIACLAACARAAPMNSYAALMLAALTLGLIGDVLLGLDRLAAENCQNFLFLVGGTPFFLGHILYISLLLSYAPLRPGLLLILPLVPLFFLLLQRLKVVRLGKLLVPLLIYGLVLGGMMLSTLNVALLGGALGRLMLLPGILFTISDTSLFLQKFGKEKLGRALPALAYSVMLPYYGAQCLFAMSVAYL